MLLAWRTRPQNEFIQSHADMLCVQDIMQKAYKSQY